MGRKKLGCLVDRQIEHLGNVQPLEAHLERLPVVAAAVTDIAWHVNVGQELHFNAQLALSLARLATPTLDVKGESARAVAAHPGFWQLGEQAAQGAKELRVGGRVGAGRAPDGALIDVDDLVDRLIALDRLVCTRFLPGPVYDLGHSLVQHLDQERALARAGDAGDADKFPEWDADIDALEVVFPCAAHHERLAIARTPRHRDGDAGPPR